MRTSPLDKLPTTFAEAEAYLGARQSRTCGNNTQVSRFGEVIAIVLHSTAVVVFTPNGQIGLHTGGWRTTTTKDRLNRVANAHGKTVSASKGAWYVHNHRSIDPTIESFYEGYVL